MLTPPPPPPAASVINVHSLTNVMSVIHTSSVINAPSIINTLSVINSTYGQLSRIPSECQTVLIQIRPDKTSGSKAISMCQTSLTTEKELTREWQKKMCRSGSEIEEIMKTYAQMKISIYKESRYTLRLPYILQ